MRFQMTLKIILFSLICAISLSSNAMFDDIYNKKDCQWIKKASMPTARSEFSSLVYKNSIYVVGGINGKRALSAFEVYDANLDKWQKLAPLPIPIHHASLGVVKDKIYLLGGFVDLTWQNANSIIYEYDIVNNLWKVHDALSRLRVGHTSESIDDKIFIIGGHGYEPSYILFYEPLKKKMKELETRMPWPADHLASVLDKNNNFIILGGRTGKGNLSKVRIFQLSTSEWRFIDGLPFATSGHIAEMIENKLHITGGEDLDNKSTFDDHWYFDLELNKWFESVKLPIGLHGLGSGVIDNSLYIFGGATGAGEKTFNSIQDKTYIFKCKN